MESVDDRILRYLDKGHTRDDVVAALEITRAAAVALRPSLLPFTPWTTQSGYLELLEFVQDHDLVYQLDPVQYSIRLLLPPGSWLLDIPEIQPHVGSLVQEDFVYTWRHPDPRVDMLQRQVARVAEEATSFGESIPKLVETRVTSGRSGCGMSLAIGMDDPEFLLNRGTERREVAIAE